MKTRNKNNIKFIPVFHYSFLKPRYWIDWLIITILACMITLPPKIRDPVLGILGKLLGKLARRARYRAFINLHYSLPEFNRTQKEYIIDRMFSTALQAIGTMAELGMRNPDRVCRRVDWYGREIIDTLFANKEKIIFLVPHSWSADIPAMLLAYEGKMMAAMFRNQTNSFMDYVWNSLRLRFGGRMHARKDGIRAFINSVRQGYYGYYLPDQDFGELKSEFVDFFATYKATLPVVGRLVKICNAHLVPLFSTYNVFTHRLEVYVRPPINNLIMHADNKTIARVINKEVEKFVRPNIEQYTWTLKLLKTRKKGDKIPYGRKELYYKNIKR